MIMEAAKVTEVVNDAKEALTFDRYMDFEEWYPAWMVNENGELIEDNDRLENLRLIFNEVKKELNIK